MYSKGALDLQRFKGSLARRASRGAARSDAPPWKMRTLLTHKTKTCAERAHARTHTQKETPVRFIFASSANNLPQIFWRSGGKTRWEKPSLATQTIDETRKADLCSTPNISCDDYQHQETPKTTFFTDKKLQKGELEDRGAAGGTGGSIRRRFLAALCGKRRPAHLLIEPNDLVHLVVVL